MQIIIIIFSGIIAFLHLYFLVLEMFLWTKPKGLKTFNMTKEVAESSRVLAANQGLYNGFLGGGIILALITNSSILLNYLLTCVVIAGIYGAFSTKILRLFLVQSLPAIITLLLIYFDYQ